MSWYIPDRSAMLLEVGEIVLDFLLSVQSLRMEVIYLSIVSQGRGVVQEDNLVRKIDLPREQIVWPLSGTFLTK